ncbi:hypothetical protein [Rhizosphaericola mali]|uniref:DUF3829 domain-containing protein n=1 Tax=Rhizosphaericola mali TaxID=2545455 RepID=A0A5P2G832_9BACT|nr:hypothetical protein [Rhizosphaericola mali]QES89373.1 hypothetical protein E0W69_012100 [Rhizosphaericola mali]
MKCKFPLLLIFIALLKTTTAQTYNDPVSYMNAISTAETEMNANYMTYLSAVAHGRRARKVEKLRLKTVEGIQECKSKILSLPYYKGDASLKKSSVSYIDVVYYVFNDDYAKLVNKEEIAEQSFDEMQAYILLKEKIAQKLGEAFNKMHDSTLQFAYRNNVKLTSQRSELGDKMEIANKLQHYTNDMFLVFFKCNWMDSKLTEAINKKKINDAEQARNSLIKYAEEGLQALKSDSLRALSGDANLAIACAQVLNFYKSMAQNDVPKMTDMFIKEDNFSKLKKTFEAKSPKDRTKQDVDAYNKSVNDINVAVNTYNNTNNNVNKKRTEILTNWDNSQNQFNDVHMPYFKK